MICGWRKTVLRNCKIESRMLKVLASEQPLLFQRVPAYESSFSKGPALVTTTFWIPELLAYENFDCIIFLLNGLFCGPGQLSCWIEVDLNTELTEVSFNKFILQFTFGSTEVDLSQLWKPSSTSEKTRFVMKKEKKVNVVWIFCLFSGMIIIQSIKCYCGFFLLLNGSLWFLYFKQFVSSRFRSQETKSKSTS